jgi:acylphosphatase
MDVITLEYTLTKTNKPIQGVGLRKAMYDFAVDMKLFGDIQNNKNGTVSGVIQGKSLLIDLFIDKLKTHGIVATTKTSLIASLNEFTIIGSSNKSNCKKFTINSAIVGLKTKLLLFIHNNRPELAGKVVHTGLDTTVVLLVHSTEDEPYFYPQFILQIKQLCGANVVITEDIVEEDLMEGKSYIDRTEVECRRDPSSGNIDKRSFYSKSSSVISEGFKNFCQYVYNIGKDSNVAKVGGTIAGGVFSAATGIDPTVAGFVGAATYSGAIQAFQPTTTTTTTTTNTTNTITSNNNRTTISALNTINSVLVYYQLYISSSSTQTSFTSGIKTVEVNLKNDKLLEADIADKIKEKWSPDLNYCSAGKLTFSMVPRASYRQSYPINPTGENAYVDEGTVINQVVCGDAHTHFLFVIAPAKQ